MNKSIKNNSHCTGCGVCSIVCSQKAIAMSTDLKGFRRPVVNNDCINCGICIKTCHEFKTFKGHPVYKSYTAYNTNKQIRDDSSSGGVFSAIATKVIDGGGFVCGAGFDNNFNLHHEIVESIIGLEGLRKSKYIESDLANVLTDMKKRLQRQFGVFVGTPCQCAALRSYLGKDMDNVLICDFICHGVASPYVFEKFKLHLTGLYGSPSKIEFRHKVNGNGSFFYFEGENGKCMIPNYKESYPFAYARGLIIADECVECKYCSLERFSDITLGDYVNGTPDYSLSTIFVNTKKGIDFIKTCEDCLVLKEEDLQVTVDKSWHLTSPNEYDSMRDKVFMNINKSWPYLEKRFFRIPIVETALYLLKNMLKKLMKIW